ncbi:MAG: hypothetical protein RL595_1456 [Planctomycetota bacterium]|jgi:hypothetical protein
MTTLITFMMALGADPAAKLDFKKDIAPIFSQHCLECHGAGKQRGGLRLDRADLAMRGGDSGTPVLVPKKPEESLLIQIITKGREGKVMPPKGEKVPPAKVELLKRWILEGANWPVESLQVTNHQHWAFNKPVRPVLPTIRQNHWAAGPMDLFIAQRLEKEGLPLSAPANKEVLLRRLSIDLIGLPPTPAEVDAFVSDTSPDAFAKQLDRLLASPRFGEKWARHWLDLGRYADSRGYGSDPLRLNAWPWRDWVIDAFNRNLSYDEFTIQQLAGDLLSNPGDDHLLATGFHRNTMTNTEGGTDDEEFRVAAVKDRVDTTGQVWMGLTLGCAKCHTHKYDPITQRDYYSFFAVFNQTADSDKGDEFPTRQIPTVFQRAEMNVFQSRLVALREKILKADLTQEQKEWEKKLQFKEDPKQIQLGEMPMSAARVASLAQGTTGFVLSLGDAQLEPKLRISNARDAFKAQAPSGKYIRIDIPGKQKMLSLAEVQVFRAGANIATKGKATQSSTDFNGPPQLAIDGNTNGDYNLAKSTTHTKIQDNPWWELALDSLGPVEKIVVWNRTDNGTGARIAGYRLQVLDETRKVVFSKESLPAPASSAEFLPNGQVEFAMAKPWRRGSARVFPMEKPLPAGEYAFLLEDSKGKLLSWNGAILESLQGSFLQERLKLPVDLRAIFDQEKFSVAEIKKLADYFRENAPSLAPFRAQIAELEKATPKLTAAPIFQELPQDKQRKTNILLKGNFLSPGSPVTPGVPGAFHPLPVGVKPDRLSLAKWMVDRENPLTARVEVNRLWALIFGRGLVETEEDFGTQGTKPTHPELLDWLAVEFMESGWDIKGLLRTIFHSSTYRQESRVTPIHLEKDPRNLLLGRSPRHRLDAELVRDQALYAAGLLSSKMYGPSVYPPQPANLWQAAFNGERNWATSSGEDKYRRGLYTFWRRTVPYPSMQTFDAPSREFCTVRRIPTSTPLQAFVTMNDPVFVEAAQGMARRVLREGGNTDQQRLAFAFKLVASQTADERQIQTLTKLLEDGRNRWTDDTKAREFSQSYLGALEANLAPREVAAWTLVCNVLLNLDAILMRS